MVVSAENMGDNSEYHWELLLPNAAEGEEQNIFDKFPDLAMDFAGLLWRILHPDKEQEFQKNPDKYLKNIPANTSYAMMPKFDDNNTDTNIIGNSFRNEFPIGDWETEWETIQQKAADDRVIGDSMLREALRSYICRVIIALLADFPSSLRHPSLLPCSTA